MKSRISKIYLSSFLEGFIFWYGIEKIFMTSIGISVVGVGIAAAVFLAINLIFEIPSGILADKWSRKGMLILSSIFLGVASLLFGISNGIFIYIIGEIFYGLYVATMSGTYQALIYDVLHEENKSKQYSKIAGKAFALFLFGSAVADLLSGFLANQIGFRAVFLISIIPCLINIFVIWRIREPRFHKSDKKDKLIPNLGTALVDIAKNNLLRALTVVMSVLAVMDLFKSEFGQLYLFRYAPGMQLIGILWAVYALTWSLGSLIAHKFRTRLDGLVILSVMPFVLMSFIDNWFCVVLFMIQAVASAALVNQIETRVQENTPSSLRASVLSVLTSIGRAITVPLSFLIGWIALSYGNLWTVRFVALLGVIMLIYWAFARRNIKQVPELADVDLPVMPELIK